MQFWTQVRPSSFPASQTPAAAAAALVLFEADTARRPPDTVQWISFILVGVIIAACDAPGGACGCT